MEPIITRYQYDAETQWIIRAERHTTSRPGGVAWIVDLPKPAQEAYSREYFDRRGDVTFYGAEPPHAHAQAVADALAAHDAALLAATKALAEALDPVFDAAAESEDEARADERNYRPHCWCSRTGHPEQRGKRHTFYPGLMGGQCGLKATPRGGAEPTD